MNDARRVFGLLAALAVASGCGGRSAAKIVEAHRTVATAKIAALEALAKPVAQQPPLPADAKLPSGVKLDLRAMLSGSEQHPESQRNPAYNAAIVFADQLSNPCSDAVPHWLQDGTPGDRITLMADKTEYWLVPPVCLVKTGKNFRDGAPPSASLLEKDFDWLDRTQYALVVRLRARRAPTLSMKEIEANDIKTFSAGNLAGGVLVYELATGKYLGGFAFDLSGGPEAKVTDDARVEEQLELQLSDRLDKYIEHELEAAGAELR